MRKSVVITTLLVGGCLSALGQSDVRDYGGKSSIGLSGTFSPDSSHILIGDARERRTWTAGAEYTRRLHESRYMRLDYEGSVLPFFKETDPTVLGTEFTAGGQLIVDKQSPVRVLRTQNGPVGTVITGSGSSVPLYAIFGKQNTYAAAVTPLGARISAMPHWTLQPSFALDLGFVVSARDIPLDDCSQFNFMFGFGPGVQFFTSARTSIRAEYLYRHLSNAGLGAQNPGIDQGVVRLTVSLHR